MLIDTHIHLDAEEYRTSLPDVLTRARQAGVAGFVLPAVEPANFSAVAALASENADVAPAYGIHPLYVDRIDDGALLALRQQLAQGGAVAVGEIGLDYYVEGLDRERLQQVYLAQLKLAREFELPVLLHLRRAQDDVLKHLRRIRVRGGIAHAFNGSRQQADAFIALGFKLGFGGAMTYTGSSRIRALARELPLECIVLETDGPDIAPAWRPQGPSLPAELPRYAAELAELRGISVDTVALQTSRNALDALPGLAARVRPALPRGQ
ncbi:TatD family hydrolase [Niveibacterium sp. 24ML]|uniref:TatD family hydrolase n=1 Tax=Niveibacterium sp. 24ML TaxID=2985512 RepID=UPI00226F9DCF|nr:TatD family hydrolase [Niveibacterium sp. 24ML]MCX9156716.1 TatD family hydrolase [Niveibacterium sp. 24ML]